MEYNERTIQLVGPEAFERILQARVILFGVGGVGGWCAEALVRTGIQHLTIVDFDTVSPSNINRQIVATQYNIGQSKVDEMRQRLLSINPDADIVALRQRLTAETVSDFDLEHFDYVIDAIDSVDDKITLLSSVHRPKLFSCMGAGRKTDTEQIRVSDFRKVEGCPLARALRTKMRKEGKMPTRPIPCVWSAEQPAKMEGQAVLGSIAPIVGVFGMKLAGLVIQDILQGISTNSL